MLISCKCLNFIATSNNQHQQQQQLQQKNSTTGAVATADDAAAIAVNSNGIIANNNVNNNTNNINTLATALMHAFLKKYSRNFSYYSQCMDFFKQSIGPIPDITINDINQRDLIYSLTLDLNQPNTGVQSWQLSICINCNTTLCAKRLHTGQILQTINGSNFNIPPQYLINCTLLTNNEELSQRRADKSFSETFGILIINHPELHIQNSTNSGTSTTTSNAMTFAIGSIPSSSLSTINGGNVIIDTQQQRLRQLQQNLQQRLKKEIADTDERIQRHNEQQFALLKSFREKSEQEFELLAQLLQRIPEQLAMEWFDRTATTLEVNGGNVGNYTGRRRNTINSRRDLNSTAVTNVTTPTTPTTPNITNQQLIFPPIITQRTQSAIEIAAAPSAIPTTINNTQGMTSTVATNTIITANNRKMSNFDTPPATPEATPMSVGNSPTFRQQQQQHGQGQQQQQQQFGRILVTSHSFQQQFPTPTIDAADDCLFDFETDDIANTVASNITNPPQYHLQRHLSQHENRMDDDNSADENDAEEAEDALGMDGSMPITMNKALLRANGRINDGNSITSVQNNFGRSLPIEIANSPAIARSYLNNDDVEDELDNNVDIAASIKALAKSVHGEAVFGDLPRPRLRSQI